MGTVQATTVRTTPQLIQTIKAHLAKASQALDKSGQHEISAGLYLKELKARKPSDRPWPEYVRETFDLGRSRADKLIEIGNRTTTPDKVRADTAGRVRASRAKQSVLRNTGSTAMAPMDVDEPDEEDEDPRLDADHEEGIRVIAARGFLNRAVEATSLAHYPRKNLIITDEAVRLASEVVEAWSELLGKLKQENGDRKECVSLYIKAIAADPEFAQWMADHPAAAADRAKTKSTRSIGNTAIKSAADRAEAR